MFELLLTRKPGGAYFPNSGPGSKYLKYGNKNLGYFGQVTAAELFDSQDMIDLGGLNGQGTVYTASGLVWLKFIRNSVVTFVAKTPVMSAISWNTLYNAGLVYGVRGYGKYPVGNGVDQLKLKSKVENTKTWWLKARLFSTAAADPFAWGGGTTPTSEITVSEWDTLMYNVAATSLTGGTGTWEKFTASDLGLISTSGTLTQETSSANTANMLTRAANTTIQYGAVWAKATASYYWRPVLELTDASGIAIEVNTVWGGALNYKPTLLWLKQQTYVTPILLRMTNAYGGYSGIKPLNLKQQSYTTPAVKVNTVFYQTTTLAPLKASISYTT